MSTSRVVHALARRGRRVQVVCGDRRAELASAAWSQVSCAACLSRLEKSDPAAAIAVLGGVQSEKAWQQQVNDLAKMGGWLCYHTHDARHSASGFPDTVLVHPQYPQCGIHFAELKRAGKGPTDAQQHWLTALGAASGHLVHVWHPQDLEAITALLAVPERR
jgi:hypothetical protein